MATHRRLPSAPAPLSRRASTFFPSPRLLTRRTLSPSRARAYVLAGVTFIALVACTFIFRLWAAADVQSLPVQHHQPYRPSSRAFRYDGVDPRRTPAHHNAKRYSFGQHPGQELGALVGFLAALASNSIPLTVDPTLHIDPELVLGFDTRTGSDEVVEEVDNIVADTWARNPVVVFSELHSTAAPASREVKNAVNALNLYPEPTVFEVDQRVDAEVLRPMLSRLTSHDSLPVVLIGGETILSAVELREAKENGSLQNMIASAGAIIDGKKQKKRKH